jgi:leucyl-tRNA synthetase
MKVRSEYKPTHIEKKWQKNWEDGKTFSLDINSSKNPYYCLMMFPYPSAEGLHVGNMYAFTGADVYARYQRMKGLDVFEPIGLDGFGIHSENFALKVGKNPKELSKISEKNFYRQLREIGNSFDLTRTLETYDPDYYKWTQWIFITLFKNGLAYRKKSSVNWCPSCKTVLSDEQVINGECERCGTRVTKKDLEQWFFKITKYAQKLLDNIENLDWSKKVKVAQTNWIGRSEGARVVFRLQTTDYGQTVDGRLKTVDRVEVFTTRPDTLFGATFMVISPEHKLVSELLESRIKNQESRIDEIRKYIEQAKMKTEQERVAEGKEKTGVFSGVYAINPVNSEKIPVWIADYVLASYGTGAIMAVPAHDQRDFEFAKKYDLPIREVIRGKGVR